MKDAASINVLAADKLYNNPKLYSTFLLWMLAELFEQLPEVGDVEKPKLVFFFDEAHLLFNDAPTALLEKIEQVVRLIRSKGVGVYFVTQNPLDIPETVLGQLGNRVQHALRAFTPRDQKAVKTAADTMRPNPAFNTVEAITELGVGEALVSFLDEKGRPAQVERAFVIAPCSRLGVLSDSRAVGGHSKARPFTGTMKRRWIANQPMKNCALPFRAPPAPAQPARSSRRSGSAHPKRRRIVGQPGRGLSDILFGRTGPRGGKTEGLVQAAAKSVARTIGSSVGREIVRGVLGSLLGGGRRR